MEEKTITKEQIDFENKMVIWLFDLSVCFGYEVKNEENGEVEMGMTTGQIEIIKDMLVRLIKANEMTFDLEPYSNAIRKIASGKTDVYKLNIVNLMRIFTDENEIYKESKKPQKPEKW